MRENLRRKWSFRINGQKQILIKRAEEKDTHVLMKIFLAKLYNKQYDDIKIEVRYAAEKRYKPDLLATDLQGEAIFWGECGEVSLEKVHTLISRYRDTHLSFAKWNINPRPFEKIIDEGLEKIKKKRQAPVDFINFTEEDRDKIADKGEILIDWGQFYHKRW
jgi:hypothetical protein